MSKIAKSQLQVHFQFYCTERIEHPQLYASNAVTCDEQDPRD